MLTTFFQHFPRHFAATAFAMVLIGTANLVLGATWTEVRTDIPQYIGGALTVAALIAAYATWKERGRAASKTS